MCLFSAATCTPQIDNAKCVPYTHIRFYLYPGARAYESLASLSIAMTSRYSVLSPWSDRGSLSCSDLKTTRCFLSLSLSLCLSLTLAISLSLSLSLYISPPLISLDLSPLLSLSLSPFLSPDLSLSSLLTLSLLVQKIFHLRPFIITCLLPSPLLYTSDQPSLLTVEM